MERPDQISELGVLPWALMALGAGVAFWVWPVVRRGEAAFARSPRREVGLRGVDLLVGLGIMLVMLSLLGAGVRAVMEIDQQTGKIKGLSDAGRLVLQLAMLLAGVGPTIVYLCVRARMAARRHWAWRLGLLMRRPVAELWLATKAVLAAVPMVLGMGAAMQVVGVLIGQPPPQLGHQMLELLAETDSPGTVAMIILMAVVVAPLTEEVIYRGLVQTSMLGMIRAARGGSGGTSGGGGGSGGRWLVIVAAAVLFGMIHADVAAWHGLPGLILLGVVLGYIYEKSGSLWPGIMVHAAFNAMNVLVVWGMKFLPQEM